MKQDIPRWSPTDTFHPFAVLAFCIVATGIELLIEKFK
jgi:hypothetical protein